MEIKSWNAEVENKNQPIICPKGFRSDFFLFEPLIEKKEI